MESVKLLGTYICKERKELEVRGNLKLELTSEMNREYLK